MTRNQENALDFSQDYFSLFGIPRSFDVNPDVLSERYLALQKQVHPDRFADATSTERRVSMQWTTRLNTGYETLKSPLQRAIYLLSLSGIEVAENPVLEPAFLMEQIELRERLEDIEQGGNGSLEELDGFRQQVRSVLDTLGEDFDQAHRRGDLETAEHAVYKMQFMYKLLRSAEQVEDRMLDY